MSDRRAYWNPLPAAQQFTSSWERTELSGKWEERNWRNVPGPFYGAETDTCATGPMVAPRHVLCDEKGMEFVYRQPQSPDSLRVFLDAVWAEPFGGYACDGDDHWTVGAVRAWWSDRGRIREWAQSLAGTCSTSSRAAVLRGYPFWSSERREPDPQEVRW